jgi:phage terminase large subunit
LNEVRISFPARPYQRPVVDYFRAGGKRAYCVWHRKAGKDRTATFIESELAFRRVGLYWHALPKYEDARKVIWDAITPDGKRLIDVNFPPAIVKRRLDHEMKLELVNGSIWQPVGADNFNSLVGAFPTHVTYSEYPLMNPQARDFLRPALAMNEGSELVIGTPRGYNHGFDLWQYANSRPDWYKSLLTVHETQVLSKEALEEERRSMPDELFRQEYECDWAAANIGAILGRYVEAAEKEGRISDGVEFDADGAGVEISSDIGRRHISAFWFWQPQVGGFSLFDYDEDNGLDAEEWIDRLNAKLDKRPLTCIWLPHDARAKTFAAKHSPVD